jgi:hypothetical protein
MNLEALEELHNKRPFVPFRLKTSDGSVYEVEQPEQLWLSELLIGVKKSGKGVFISPDHIVSTEVIKSETTLQKKTQQLQQLIDRIPFRPFSLRLINGTRYDFQTLKDLGAPKKLGYTLFYFGEDDSALIDVENIEEILDETTN